MGDPAYFQSLIEPILAGHKWLICFDAARAAAPFLEQLRSLDAPKPLLLAGIEGAGDPIDPGLAEQIVLGTGGDTIMEGMRAYAAALRNLPAWVIEQIEAWDPNGEATVMGTGIDTSFDILGRPSYGMRPAEWADLENKTTVQEIWEAAAVETAPFEVVAADRTALDAAASRLDAGHGTVWVGDNREGWHGGAEYLRVVTDQSTADEAAAFLSAHSDTVRIMPWLEGVPCSVHAMVFPDYIAAFRPTEMLVFRTPDSNRLMYGGLASWWEPPPEDRDYMRDAVRRVAAVLRDRVDYRGALGIDGVLTSDGFRPTELNPRMSPGLAVQGLHPEGSFSLGTLNRALVEGELLDYRPPTLESEVLANAEEYPQMRVMILPSRAGDTTTKLPIVVTDGEVQLASGDGAHGSLSFGPSAQGGLVMLRVAPQHAVRGPSAAPTAASAAALADDVWDTGIGPLIPATRVR